MPAPIPDEARSRIVCYAALGYTRQEIADEVGVSRNTVRKYLRRTREVAERADDPREAVAEIVRNRYDWERPDHPADRVFGDMPM